jgi:hypothetical protein
LVPIIDTFRKPAYDKVIAFVKEILENTSKLTQHIIDLTMKAKI